MQTYQGGTCDRKASPVLEDLYEELMKQPDPEAQSLATSSGIICDRFSGYLCEAYQC